MFFPRRPNGNMPAVRGPLRFIHGEIPSVQEMQIGITEMMQMQRKVSANTHPIRGDFLICTEMCLSGVLIGMGPTILAL